MEPQMTLAPNQLLNLRIERGRAGLRLRYLLSPVVEDFFKNISGGQTSAADLLGWRCGKVIGGGPLYFYNMASADIQRFASRTWGLQHNTGRLQGHPDYGDNFTNIAFLRTVGASINPVLLSLPGTISVDNLSAGFRASLADFSASFLTERVVDIRVTEE